MQPTQVASLVIAPKIAHVAPSHAKPAMAAQTTVATGLLVKTSQKAVAASAVADSLAVTAMTVLLVVNMVHAMTARHVTTALHAVTSATATVHAMTARQRAAHSATQTVVTLVRRSIVTATATTVALAAMTVLVHATTVLRVETSVHAMTVALAVMTALALSATDVAATEWSATASVTENSQTLAKTTPTRRLSSKTWFLSV